MRFLALMILLLLALTSCYKPKSASAKLGSHDRPIVMAFVPSVEAQKVMESGDRLAQMLGESTGLSFKTITATDYPGIVEALSTGSVDVAWLPPLAYVLAHERNGAEVKLKVVRHGSPTYRGQILVAPAGPVKTLADLKGKKIAFPQRTSASGYMYPKVLLLDSGIDVDKDCTEIFSGSHDAALIALVKGNVDAACTFDDARDNISKTYPDVAKLRVLAKTQDIPADCVAVSASLDQAVADQVATALINLAADAQGKQILLDLYQIEGLVDATDTDYDPVRQMAQKLDMDIESEVKKGQ
jgi:phosphonate transport system substrate-binding protein